MRAWLASRFLVINTQSYLGAWPRVPKYSPQSELIMSPSIFNILVTLIIAVGLSLWFRERDAEVTGFRLAIQWPPAFCSTSPKTCDRVKQEFTIHGLCSYDSQNRSIIKCNASAFAVKNVSFWLLYICVRLFHFDALKNVFDRFLRPKTHLLR